MSSLRVYLAAPLFTEGEKMFNAMLGNRLRQKGFEVYVPQEQGEDARNRSRQEDTTIFSRHLEALNHTDLLIALGDGPDMDSGTAWEAGYAFARGVPVITLRTDSRMIGDERRVNLMLEQSSEVVISSVELIRLLTHRYRPHSEES